MTFNIIVSLGLIINFALTVFNLLLSSLIADKYSNIDLEIKVFRNIVHEISKEGEK